MIKYNIITLFPEIIEKHLEYLPYRRALEKGLIEVNMVDLKDYGLDNYGTVDGKPYGGGVGMILRVEPIFNALKDLNLVSEEGKSLKNEDKNSKVVLLSPKGTRYSQKTAREYKNLDEITLICGRYEGVDARVEHFVDEIVSIGDYILSGGELGALVIAESVTRLIPGVLEKGEAVEMESFSEIDFFSEIESFGTGKLEYPQYTRPEEFKGLKVPDILLSGDHKEIEKWRKKNSKTI